MPETPTPTPPPGIGNPTAPVPKAALLPATVTAFLTVESRRLGPKTVQRVATALRSLLRFWHLQGLTGGPLDRASYACHCGYVFTAPVSTTVACPHCGAGQPW